MALLERIADSLPELRPLLGKLHVLSREYTGVGCYTNFMAIEPNPNLPNSMPPVEAHIEMPGVPSGLSAYLAIDRGSPRFLEIVTYGGEYWDGCYEGFSLVAG
jgi:hypothetical protein